MELNMRDYINLDLKLVKGRLDGVTIRIMLVNS